MPVNYNGQEVSVINYNGQEISALNYNGQEVPFGGGGGYRWEPEEVLIQQPGQTYGVRLIRHPEDFTQLYFRSTADFSICTPEVTLLFDIDIPGFRYTDFFADMEEYCQGKFSLNGLDAAFCIYINPFNTLEIAPRVAGYGSCGASSDFGLTFGLAYDPDTGLFSGESSFDYEDISLTLTASEDGGFYVTILGEVASETIYLRKG